MAEQVSRRRLYRSYLFSKEYCWKNRFSLSCIWSCRIRNLCKKVRGTHKNAYRHITVTKFLSTRSVWGVRSVFRHVIEKDVRYFKCIQDSSKGRRPNIATCLGISEQTLNRYGIAFGAENNFTDITILPQIERHMELSMMVHWLTLKLTTMLLCQSHRFSLQITNCRNCKIGLTLSLMMATMELIISGHCGDRGRFHWLVMKNNVLNSNQKYCQACCDGNGSSRTNDHCYHMSCYHMSFIRMKNLSPDIDFIKNNASWTSTSQ